MAAPIEVDRDLQRLEAELKRLEAEYTMYFSGRLPRPPWETRSRVEALIKHYDRAPIQNYADRFRFSTLQARFAAFVELWDRSLRAREEGRGGPVMPAHPLPQPETAKRPDRIVHVAAFQDPGHEPDKLAELYQSLSEARHEVGEPVVSFDRFADLVTSQVDRWRQAGNPEVAFRVAVKDGKVSLTARPLKGLKS